MENNDWPAGINQPPGYNLEMMHSNNRKEGLLYKGLSSDEQRAIAHRACCAYCQIHDLCNNVWDKERAFQLIQAVM
jgi:hypothetical protein